MPTKEETEKFLAETAERLKGPLSDSERAFWAEARKDARQYLKSLGKS